MSNLQTTLIEPTTAGIPTAPQPTNMYDSLIVTADNLGVGETVNILVIAGLTELQVLFPDGTDATLTPTIQGCALTGGPSYVFVKSVTAAACGVYLDYKLK
jgi:hypothetical protein